MNVELKDITLQCAACGQPFVWTAMKQLRAQLVHDPRQARVPTVCNKCKKHAETQSKNFRKVHKRRIMWRDNWHCKRCGRETPETLLGTNEPNAPELGHIVPSSLGGIASYENCQCECYECNHGQKDEVEIKGVHPADLLEQLNERALEKRIAYEYMKPRNAKND